MRGEAVGLIAGELRDTLSRTPKLEAGPQIANVLGLLSTVGACCMRRILTPVV